MLLVSPLSMTWDTPVSARHSRTLAHSHWAVMPTVIELRYQPSSLYRSCWLRSTIRTQVSLSLPTWYLSVSAHFWESLASEAPERTNTVPLPLWEHQRDQWQDLLLALSHLLRPASPMQCRCITQTLPMESSPSSHSRDLDKPRVLPQWPSDAAGNSW